MVKLTTIITMALLFFGIQLNAQTDEEYLIEKAIKNVQPEFNISYNISTIDISPSLADIAGDKPIILDSLRALEEKLTKTPNEINLYYSIGSSYNKLKDYEQAQNYLKRGVEVAQGLTLKYPDSSQIISSLGMIYTELGDAHKAANKFLEAYHINPKDTIATYFGLLTLISIGDLERARTYANSFIYDNPESAANYVWLFMINFFGTMKEMMQMEEEVRIPLVKSMQSTEIFDIQFIEKAVDSFPDNFQIMFLRNMIHNISLLSKGMYSTVSVSEDKLELVFDAQDLKEMKTLEKFFKEGLKRKDFPNKYGFYKSLGIIMIMKEENKSAVQYFEKALKDFPKDKNTRLNNTSPEYENLIAAHFMLKNEDGVKKVLEKKIKDRPQIDSSANDYAYLAYFPLKEKNLAEAKEYCNIALGIDSRSDAAYRTSSVIKMLEKDYKGAEEELNKAYEVNKDSENNYYLLGILYLLKDDKKSAEYMFKELQRTNPDWENSNKIIAKFLPELVKTETKD